MAIYRCEFKIISRGSGHRACAAAAYRAGEKIRDERYGDTHDYTRKSGVAASFILAPENAPDWMSNRAELWNAVEAVERRKDAQLCREVLLSLPHELADDQREALVRQFVRDHFVSRGMVADVNIHTHSPSGDERNDHAHILLTTRTLTASSFGPKERSWNSRDFVHDTREAWAEAQNRTFERLGLDLRVDHRSLADQGIDREPEPKLGQHATESIRNGEPEKADRVVQHHETVMERNAERERLKNEREVIDLALARLDRTRGERDANEFAELAAHHARQMRNLQAAQAASLYALRREQLTTLRAAVRAARADHDQFRKELTPGFLQRMGEIVTLKGRAMRQKRDSALREFKSQQDSRLNALRARQRRELAALKDHHAEELARLRKGQGGERDDLALRQQQRFEREQALLRARHAGGGSAPRSANEVLFTRPEDASPTLSPETPSDTPREPRDGLSGVWDSHALPPSPSGGTEAAEGGEERGESGAGSAGGSAGLGGKPRADEEARTPPAPPLGDETAPPREAERDPDDGVRPSSPGQASDDTRARNEREDDAPRARTGLFAKKDQRAAGKPARAEDVLIPKKGGRRDAKNARGRAEEPKDKPHFLDPDYKGPSKDELDRARDLEKAIRVHKAREARKRAAERRRLERERRKDRDGPER
ncbi:MobQ family relaxase [Salipiger abyssi]|uniref:MobA/MobL family protein n=1 Tax=Salipiger abyssi TaxID=1250539 RepID=A0A1P8V121_9RHOB|nr:MobQ family relaxase [Salipiger abyssi]APZ55350.1 MobA/MobL family protein [Salipiger abyssi]